jgi:molybdopterin synthase catalytic subunit
MAMWTEIKFFDAAWPSPPPAPPAALAGQCGAWAEFTGIVRAREKDATIAALRYEIHRAMAEKVLAGHLDELGKKHGVLAVRFWHREGIVPVGEAAVYTAVAAPHRKEAFAALAELMDRLKTDVPIWKVESLPA